MKINHKQAIKSAKLSLKKMAEDVKDPAAIIGGMVLGKLASDMLDKALATTSTVSGLKGVTSMGSILKPALLIGGGLAAKQLVKNPIIKNVGIGIAAYGGAVAISSVVAIPGLSSSTTQKALPPATTDTGITASGLGATFRGKFTPDSPARLLHDNSFPKLSKIQ